MAKDVGDAIGAALGHAAREVAQTVSANAHKASKSSASGALSGGRGVAAGAGLAALVPLAAKGAGKLMRGMGNGSGPVQMATDKLTGGVQDAVGKSVDKAGGASGLAKEAGKSMLPGGKSSGGGGVGKGRRMPIQQSVDVAVPLEAAYEGWTQFEDWPQFMHRLERVTQEDDSTVSFKAKIWGISREFTAEITEQRPNDRIKWRVTDGVSHTGVVSFHELAPRLTRIDVDVHVEPGSMIEKLGRGLRHAKRAVRADLHRFKAHVEIEEETPDDDGEEQRTSSAASRSSSSRSASGGSSSGRRTSSSGRSSSRGSSSRRSSSGSGSGSGGSRTSKSS
jgi:uncharacterized membrane protein